MNRRWVFIAVGIMVTTAAVYRFRPESGVLPTVQQEVITATADGMDLVTATDPALVFQKAFWRRPAADDEILHAERREWSTEDGVRKWQWFIAVRPGPAFWEWLDSNPFLLATVSSAEGFEKPPEWFPSPSGEFQIQQNGDGNLTLMRSSDQKLLYGTDSGFGFAAPGIAP